MNGLRNRSSVRRKRLPTAKSCWRMWRYSFDPTATALKRWSPEVFDWALINCSEEMWSLLKYFFISWMSRKLSNFIIFTSSIHRTRPRVHHHVNQSISQIIRHAESFTLLTKQSIDFLWVSLLRQIQRRVKLKIWILFYGNFQNLVGLQADLNNEPSQSEQFTKSHNPPDTANNSALSQSRCNQKEHCLGNKSQPGVNRTNNKWNKKF